MEYVTSLIDNRRRVGIGNVKKYFPELFNRVIDDFMKIVNEVLSKEINYNFNKFEERIKREIYFFWNLLDNPSKKNNPDKIISQLLKELNRVDEKTLNIIYYLILDNFIGYDIDNLELLKKLNRKR